MARKRGNGEGSIYRRKDGRWAAKYTSVDGKRKEVYAKTCKEVARKRAEAVSGREENPSTEGTPKLGEYLSSWLNGSLKGSVLPSPPTWRTSTTSTPSKAPWTSSSS
jgi:integrase